MAAKQHQIARHGLFLGQKLEFGRLLQIIGAAEGIRKAGAAVDFVHKVRAVGFLFQCSSGAAAILGAGKIRGVGYLKDLQPIPHGKRAAGAPLLRSAGLAASASTRGALAISAARSAALAAAAIEIE